MSGNSCFFKGAGIKSLPLLSTLHSYVPIIAFKKNDCLNGVMQKYKNIYHNLPLFTTLLISFDFKMNLTLKTLEILPVKTSLKRSNA